VAGHVFVDTDTHLHQVEEWNRELMPAAYNKILDAVAGQLTDAATCQADQTEAVLGSFYTLAQRTHEGFNQYR
jgi:hypothetical protein